MHNNLWDVHNVTQASLLSAPQSPQQLKQLLMVAGQDPVLPDRAMSPGRGAARRPGASSSPSSTSGCRSSTRRTSSPSSSRSTPATSGRCMASRCPAPFPATPRTDARRGSAPTSPDLRYGMELADLGWPCSRGRGSTPSALQFCPRRTAPSRASRAPGGEQLSRKELDQLVQRPKGRGAAGLVWMVVEADGACARPVEKHLSKEEVDGGPRGDRHLRRGTSCASSPIESGPGARRAGRTPPAPGGDGWDFIPEGEWRLRLVHRPASVRLERRGGQMGGQTTIRSRPLRPTTSIRRPRRRRAYDLVLNGFEVGGSSVGIHDRRCSE